MHAWCWPWNSVVNSTQDHGWSESILLMIDRAIDWSSIPRSNLLVSIMAMPSPAPERPSRPRSSQIAAAQLPAYENPEAKLRYQVYRSEYLRYEAYRFAGFCNLYLTPLADVFNAMCMTICSFCMKQPCSGCNLKVKLSWCAFLCSRLQSTSVAIGENFPIPEIVAVGGQSDGKSSLLEAFLGVRKSPARPVISLCSLLRTDCVHVLGCAMCNAVPFQCPRSWDGHQEATHCTDVPWSHSTWATLQASGKVEAGWHAMILCCHVPIIKHGLESLIYWEERPLGDIP